MPATPNITLTATLDDTSGNADANACLWITLCGFYQTVPKIAGTSMLAKIGPIRYIEASGVFSVPLWGNDQITPAGTYYCVEIQDDKGNIPQSGNYQFTGSGTIDLSNATQLDLQPAPPPSTDIYVVVASSATPVFAPTLSPLVTYDFTLTENVTSSGASGFAKGTIVMFILRQNGTGGWTFTWPGNAENAPAVDTAANSTTTAIFIADINGALWPLAGGIWS